jgi:hypothetical protein
MGLGGLRSMVLGVLVMTVRYVSMMGGFLMVACLVMLGGFAMVPARMLMVLGSLVMMMRGFF